jgi:3-oxoacyl-[acyl-carrier protein] reductase
VDLGLDGKVAWVLGASSGLGRSSALALGREGARVAVSARREDELKNVATEIGEATGNESIAVVCDVSDGEAIASAAQRVRSELGPIDVLVSNAGGPPPGTFEDLDEDALHGAFVLTTASAWRLAKAVVPDMRAGSGGCLIFLTSGSTKEVMPNLLLSNMMRAAVVGMAKTLSKELGPSGIRTVCVAPGRIETDRLQQLDEAASARTGKSVDEIRRGIQATIPQGRYGRPEEFGDVVAFLASERASFINGVTVVVDGGMLNGILT